MTDPNHKKPWYEDLLRYLPAIMLVGGGLYSFFITWDEVKRLRKELEVVKEERDLSLLKEQVQRQYTVQREMNEKTNSEVNELKMWRSFMLGKEAVKKEYEK